MDKIDARVQGNRLLAANLLKHYGVGHPGELANFFWI